MPPYGKEIASAKELDLRQLGKVLIYILNITKQSLFNSVPLNEMELHKMTKELALRP